MEFSLLVAKEVIGIWLAYLLINLVDLKLQRVRSCLIVGQTSIAGITWNGTENPKADDEFGDFQSADQKGETFAKNYKKEELDLLDLDNMSK